MAKYPRAKLVMSVTPIERLTQLSDQLGIELMVKRDDLAGTTFGGNKSRQLKF